MRLARTAVTALIASTTLLVAAPASPIAAATPASDLFISEYIEGSSNNKAIEIYNGTAGPVDLSTYTLSQYSNGGITTSAVLVPSGTLASGDVYVIAHSSSDPAILAVADLTTGTGLFNGDDALVLRNGDTVVDSIGQVGYDPGSQWGVDLISTADNTLRRKPSVCAGDTNPDDVFDPALEWDGFANNTFDGLGAHTSDCVDAPAGSVGDILLTEIVVTPTGGEFIEIYNGGIGDVDLSDVYVTDATFAGGSTYYYNIVTGTNAGGGGFGDFHARFPDGAGIAAGEYQTIALAGSTAYAGVYSADPTYELFEDDATPDSIADMREAFPGSINGQGGLTNGGEFVVLYTWDGASDLVADIDYVVWGDRDEAVDKTGIAIDGPDVDTDPSAYLADTALASQDLIAPGAHPNGSTFQRDDLTEGTETATGGNGVNGDDETSENLSETWCTAAPTPGAADSCPEPPQYAPTPIFTIQGTGDTSAMVGQGVEIDGIVVADLQDSDQLNGFYVQEFPGDGDSLTSDGIYVFEGGSPVDVNVGDFVVVTGEVAEFSNLTEITSVNSVTVVSSGNAVPAPTEIVLPMTPAELEALEGMSVVAPQALRIAEFFNYDRYGEVVLSNGFDGLDRHYTPTAYVSPGAAAQAELAKILANRITLDDASGLQNPEFLRMPDGTQFLPGNTFRGGDTVTGVVGVLDYARDTYRIQPTEPATYANTNPRPTAPDAVDGDLKIASLNVLNYFVTIDEGGATCGPDGVNCRGADSGAEFDRQRAKLINALVAMDADIVGLVELENTPGVEPLADITAGLNDVLGAGTYDYIETGMIGTDVIKVGIIYRPAAVMPWGDYAILDSSVDPRFLDDLNRPSLAQSFLDLDTGGITTVAANHWKSKGSGCDATTGVDNGDGQGNCNIARTMAAEAIVDWLASDPTGSGQGDAILMGDLNSYDEEDPIQVLLNAGYIDIDEMIEGEFGYSYVFDGQLGSLDYSMTNASLATQVVDATVWHVNSDEPDALDYNTDFRGPVQVSLYDSGAFRFSDHDPVIVGLDLDVDSAVLLDALDSTLAEVVASGSLNKGQTKALQNKLAQARRQIERGQFNGAKGGLTGFIAQLGGFVDGGILTADQAAPLITLATVLRSGIAGGNTDVNEGNHSGGHGHGQGDNHGWRPPSHGHSQRAC